MAGGEVKVVSAPGVSTGKVSVEAPVTVALPRSFAVRLLSTGSTAVLSFIQTSEPRPARPWGAVVVIVASVPLNEMLCTCNPLL